MQIKRTQPNVASGSTITVNFPKVNADAVSDGIWNAADTFVAGAQKAGAGLLYGGASMIPTLGLTGAQEMKADFESGEMRKTGLNQLTNAGTAAAQIAGMTAGVLAVGSAITGIGNAWTMLKISGGCFMAGGVSAFATVVASDHKDVFN